MNHRGCTMFDAIPVTWPHIDVVDVTTKLPPRLEPACSANTMACNPVAKILQLL